MISAAFFFHWLDDNIIGSNGLAYHSQITINFSVWYTPYQFLIFLRSVNQRVFYSTAILFTNNECISSSAK